jgi:hypothetical protein
MSMAFTVTVWNTLFLSQTTHGVSITKTNQLLVSGNNPRLLWESHETQTNKKQTPWPQSASELYRPSDRRLLAKLVPTFADRRCHVVSVTDPYDRILAFLDRSRYFFFQAAPQLYSRGWVDFVPDALLLRKSRSAGNRTRTFVSVARNSWPLDHRGGPHETQRGQNAALLNVKADGTPGYHWTWNEETGPLMKVCHAGKQLT